MKFAGELRVRAAREEVFDRLKNPQFFASCIEGVRDLVEVTPTQYSAIFETKIAYITFKFRLAVEMTEAERPAAIAAKIEGKPHGIAGRLSATSAANFIEIEGETAIQYLIEANLAGRLGGLGQPVLKSKAKEMERQFVQNLRAAFEDRMEVVGP